MKKLFVSATALLLIVGSAAYAQGGGGGAGGGAPGGANGGMGGTSGGTGTTSSTGPTGAQSDTGYPPAPNSITAGNRTGKNSNSTPLPGQPGNPQTGPIRR